MGDPFSDLALICDPQRDPMVSLPLVSDAVSHPYVEMCFAGGVTVTAVLDTGAGVTLLDAGFARRHPQLVTVTDSAAGTDATGATRHTETGTLQTVCIGGTRFEASRVAIFDLDNVNSPDRPRVGAIVGFPLLRQADWLIDIPHQPWAVKQPAPAGRDTQPRGP